MSQNKKLNKVQLANIALSSQVKLANCILSLQLEEVADCSWNDQYDAQMKLIEQNIKDIVLSNDKTFSYMNKLLINQSNKIIKEYWNLSKKVDLQPSLTEYFDSDKEEEINYKS